MGFAESGFLRRTRELRALRPGCNGSRPVALPRSGEGWSRLGSNQRPSACEADALPLSYETEGVGRMAERRRRLARVGAVPESARRDRGAAADRAYRTGRREPAVHQDETDVTSGGDGRRGPIRRGRLTCGFRSRRTGKRRDLCSRSTVDYCRASQRATISLVARGCSAVGSASPCQGEGRGFESRHPLEGVAASTPTVEWPSGEATACKAVHTGSIPVSTSRRPGAISSAGERFPDTEEVTGSIPVSRTTVYAGQSRFLRV